MAHLLCLISNHRKLDECNEQQEKRIRSYSNCPRHVSQTLKYIAMQCKKKKTCTIYICMEELYSLFIVLMEFSMFM